MQSRPMTWRGWLTLLVVLAIGAEVVALAIWGAGAADEVVETYLARGEEDMDRKLDEVLPGTVQTNLLGRNVAISPGAYRRATGCEMLGMEGEVVALFAVSTLSGSGFKVLVYCEDRKRDAMGNMLELWVSDISAVD